MAPWNGLFERLRSKAYGRRQPLILINGLAEQPESWFRNRRFWMRYFDVHTPNILAYDGPGLHRRMAEKKPVNVDYLVEQFHAYMDQFVQSPPYHLVASSLGGKIAVELASRYPDLVSRVVLICPSGMGDEEQLPVMAGVRRQDMQAVVRSVFHSPRFVDRDIVKFYKSQINNRKWRAGLLRAINGTKDYTVREKMKTVQAPTLLITGTEDKICDPKTAEEAYRELPNGHFLAIPGCGHAPQIEKHWLINRLVVHFLTAEKPTAHPKWTQLLLAKPTRAPQ